MIAGETRATSAQTCAELERDEIRVLRERPESSLPALLRLSYPPGVEKSVERLIDSALEEDIGTGDLTSKYVVPEERRAAGEGAYAFYTTAPEGS